MADQVLGLQFKVELCYFVVGLALVFNIIVSFLFPQNKRPGEVQVAGILVFDVTQLCLLIYLTGGLNNPFALLVLAPVAVAAAALNIGALAVLVGVTICLVTFVGL